jgi:UDP-3-O-[3-hydroxymyristoyl] glucosamine N-acyltransferase
MADPRFYRRAGPFSLAQIAKRVGGGLAVGVDSARAISDVASLSTAGADEIAFVADAAYGVFLAESRCGAVILKPDSRTPIPVTCAVIEAPDPRAAFAAAVALFYADGTPPPGPLPRIATDAAVHPTAVLSEGVEIGPGAQIGPHAVIGHGVRIGAGSRIGANVTLTHSLVGARVIVHPGAQIGQDGFGFFAAAGGPMKIPQVGRVLIGDDVEIGANTTIDRGALEDTIIGDGTKIDNLVQIGHNVEIGRFCVIAGQVGLSGSCKIGDGVVIGGQAGLADHVTVGAGAQIAAKTGIMRDIPPKQTVMGYPARPIRQFWREIVALSRLTRRDD